MGLRGTLGKEHRLILPPAATWSPEGRWEFSGMRAGAAATVLCYGFPGRLVCGYGVSNRASISTNPAIFLSRVEACLTELVR